VTPDARTVDGVPAGCKRVSESLKIVDNENDAYEADDVPLTKVVADPALDAAVLRAKGALPVLPWKIGRSAALHERDAVEVRGFPLGAFHAINVGKVVSAFQHDDEGAWDHDDFVVDALLSNGNSGSPVLAASCKTGELELVGIYHAGYLLGSALNVVVGIDQLRDLMTTLKRTPRSHGDGAVALDDAARATLLRCGRAATARWCSKCSRAIFRSTRRRCSPTKIWRWPEASATSGACGSAASPASSRTGAPISTPTDKPR
jgi:serine protease Do